jgi:hypothetical protein
VLVAIREDEARLEAQPQPPVAEQAVAELYPLLTAAQAVLGVPRGGIGAPGLAVSLI